MARSINRSNPFPALPKGGEPGQVLVKKDKPDGEADWDWVSAGGDGPAMLGGTFRPVLCQNLKNSYLLETQN